MAVHKRLVIEQIRQYGAKDILRGFDGTDEEAIKAVQADPREVFCSCTCEQDETGACTGVVRS